MLNFIFCLHIHQPVGNFDYVIKDAFKRAYFPFLKTINEYPEVKFCLHISGVLIDWLKGYEEEYLRLLRSMVDRGQVELIGGGYYEPILTAIPERDRLGQLKLMTEELKTLFGVKAKGIWVTERVWEPHLPKTLSEAGMEYAVVDDYHFIKAGLRYEDLFGYYITEEEGSYIKLFPGSERLRYLIPFKPVDEFIGYLKGISNPQATTHNPQLIVFADDGEKFGIWPGTYTYVYKEGWLRGFLDALRENKQWIKTVTFSNYLKDSKSLGRIYLPTASYREMEEWALPAEAVETFSSLYNEIKGWQDGVRILRFLKGGFWRNFLTKYPEADWMHKRMLQVSNQLLALSGGKRTDPSSLATYYLYKAQCNDAYWHGVFGGLYLPHLRSAVYENLIKAERLLEGMRLKALSVNKNLNPATCNLHREEVDLDCDTHKEIGLTTPTLCLFIGPRQGGFIRELDYRPKAYNLINVLSRHKEGYHSRLRGQGSVIRGQGAKSIHDLIATKEEGLERLLVYDNYIRGGFHDRFFKEDITLKDLMMGRFGEMGDFVKGEYSLNKESRERESEVYLFREGTAFGQPVRVEKVFYIDGDKPKLMVKYTITNLGEREIKGIFCSEINLLLGFGLERKPMNYGDISKFLIGDDWLGFNLIFSFHPEAGLFRYPVETVSLSEGGAERLFQGNCILPLWRLLLNPTASICVDIGLEIIEAPKNP